MTMDPFACNECHQPLEGIVYWTCCNHIFCPACAQTCFRQRKACPVCTQQLDVHDIHETTAGVKGADITDHFFQLALSSPSLLQAGEQVCGGLAALQKLVTFLTTQQLTKTKCNEDMRAVYESNLQAKEQELLDTKQSCTEQLQEMEQTIGRLQAELADKSREEAQLQDSLKEKIRKCQAWEKAYTNIRQQLINHPPLAPPQPPKPPPPVQPQWASPLPQQHWPQQQAPQWPQPPPQPQLQRAHQQTYWQQTPQQTSYTSRTVATVATPEPLPAFLRQDPYKQQQPAPVYPPPRTTGYYQETRRPSLPPPSRPSYPHPQLRHEPERMEPLPVIGQKRPAMDGSNGDRRLQFASYARVDQRDSRGGFFDRR